MKNFISHRLLIFIAIIFSISKLSKAQSFALPTSLPGLKLWLTGDSCKLNNSFLIDTVYDLSGNSNHAKQTNSAFKPTINPSLLNGHKTMLFDGIDDYISFNSINDTRTVFFILKSNPSALGYIPLLGHSTAYDFIGEGQILFSNSYASPNVLNGTLHLNQLTIPTNSSRPINYSIVSLLTTASTFVDNFSRDRFYSDRVWNGELVELIIYNQALSNNQVTQIENYLNDKYAPPIQLPNDITVLNSYCDTIIKLVNPNNNQYHNYIWSNGATTNSITVNQSGKYWLKATNLFGKESSDTIIVQFPNYYFPTQSIICTGNHLKWNTNLPKSDFTFLWQDNSIDSVFNITQAGNYYTSITDGFGCSINTNTITITEDDFPNTTTLGTDVSLCVGNTISLQTNTISANTYTWSDGSHNPNLTMNVTGQYFVAVTNTNSCLAKDTINVIILGQAPTVAFNKSIGCRNSAVTFTNLSTAPAGNTITGIYWNFGNTSSSTNTTIINNPTHTYLDTGMYLISLTINTDVGCSNYQSQTIHIAPTPTVNFVNGIACQNDSTAFASIITSPNYSVVSKQWHFGDIASGVANTSTLANPKHLYANQLNYTTRLVVTNNAGCKDSITKAVVVNAQVKADFNYSAACTNSLMKFTDNSIAPAPNNTNIRQWNLGSSSATGTIINQFYSISAIYPITLTVIGNNGCISTTVKQVSVTAPPTCSFSTAPNFCVTDSVLLTDISTGDFPIQNWNWIKNTNVYSTLPSVYFKNTISGIQSIKLKVIDTKGCTDSTSKNIEIYPLPIISFSTTPQDVFAYTTTTLTPSTNTASVYNWIGTNSFFSSATKPIYTFGDTGVYQFTLQIKDVNGCINSHTTTFHINNKRTDLAILDITASIQNDGYVDMIAHLVNLGTAPITQFKLNAFVTNSSTIKEQWFGTLNKGNLLDYHFQSSILANDITRNSLNCMEISEINFGIDDDTQNNKYCVELYPNGITVYDAYPNPSSNTINLPVSLKNDGSLQIEIRNALGENIYSENKNATAGLTIIPLSISGYARGCYFVTITIGDKFFVQKIMRD